MLSMLAGALLMTACTYAGMSVKKIYRKRNKVFATFEKLAIILKGEIKCRKTPLIEILELFVKDKKGMAINIIENYLKCLKTGVTNANDIYEHTKNIFLNTEENQMIANFLCSLGKNDIESEIENLERYELNFNMLKQSTEVDCEKKGDMYFKLLVLLGVALMIIVV